MPAWSLLLSFLAAAAPATASPDVTSSALAWLAGHWVCTDEGRRMEEVWLAPAGGVMPGVQRDVREGRPTYFEWLRIEDREDGVVYVASPRGAAPTEFRLVLLTERRAVFENADHDFPQRIEYRLEGDELVAGIGDLDEASGRGAEWRFRRRAASP